MRGLPTELYTNLQTTPWLKARAAAAEAQPIAESINASAAHCVGFTNLGAPDPGLRGLALGYTLLTHYVGSHGVLKGREFVVLTTGSVRERR